MMYSATLLAVVLQRLAGRLGHIEEMPRLLKLPVDLAMFANVAKAQEHESLPVVLHSTRSTSILRSAFPGLRFDDIQGGMFGSGLASVNELVRYAIQSAEVPPHDEYVDLGTPIVAFASGSAANCQAIVPRTSDSTSAQALVVVVDSGVSKAGNVPDTFGGKVTHLVTQDVDFSPHALDVLSTLLAELVRLGIASRVHVVCALVVPPLSVSAQLAQASVLELDNVVHLSAVLSDVRRYLQGSVLPAVVNISMGTHVGPHMGTTPLERLAASLVDPGASRYVIVAAGNDGERGCHASRHLEGGDPDTLQLLVPPSGVRELMVDFWWEDTGAQDLILEIEALDASGKDIFSGPLSIDTASGRSPRPAVGSRRSQQVLVGSPGQLGGLRGIAYALEAKSPSDLASASLRVDILPKNDAFIHAWVILADDYRTTWSPSEAHGTVSVPSTAGDMIAVGGVDGASRPWTQSSRGLSNCFATGAQGGRCWMHGAFNSPTVAANIASIPHGEEGTSFSAPRVSAAVLAHVLQNPPQTLDDMVIKLVGQSARWSPRRGYGFI